MDTNTSIKPDLIPPVLFVTGTGTDVGKSWATGWLARELARAGSNVITQKFIQTGNCGRSEDIEVHRSIMGIPLQPRDLDGTTAPIILSYPASPHLAARIDGIEIDWEVPAASSRQLACEYDHVLIEGAGGALVPLNDRLLTADWIARHDLPAAVVTGGMLGSINHTLLTLEALEARGVKVALVIYNPHFDTDEVICPDTRAYLRRYLSRHHPGAIWLEMLENL